MKKATKYTGSCRDCFFWEDGRGGERRPLTTTKRKTCYEKGLIAGDGCRQFIPIHMHPLCGTCNWLDKPWHAMDCRERYEANERTTANYLCKDKYELRDDYKQAVVKDNNALLYNSGRPIQVLDVDTAISQDIMLRMGDQAILITEGTARTIKLDRRLPVIEKQAGAYTFQSTESPTLEIEEEDVKSEVTLEETPPREERKHSNVIGEVAEQTVHNLKLEEELIQKMLLQIASMEHQRISRDRAIVRAVKIAGRKYSWSKQMKIEAVAMLKKRVHQ